ncbi:MAG: site-specific integrase [Alphaproteobacteria bacterium]
MDTLDLAGGKLHLYKRDRSRVWQCSTFIDGKNYRQTTKQRDVERAKEIAEEWYLSLRVKHRAGEIGGPTFAQAADKFLPEYETLTAGERNVQYVKSHGDRLRVHLLPFFGKLPVSRIGSQTAQDYRVRRRTKPKEAEDREALELQKVKEAKEKGLTYKPKKPWTPPANSTLKHEIVTLRLVLKTAQRLEWIKYVPDLSPPYRGSGKISHRAWFSLEEYKQLYNATRERAANPPKPRWKWECEQLHDFVLFMVNTGLRPDEARRLEFRDVEIVKDKATDETILEISVRGKRGVGYCKSMPGAVPPFERLRDRKRATNVTSRASKGGSVSGDENKLVLPGPTDRLFPALRHHHLNAVLEELGLKFDREGLRRSAYSLRHTYISLRLMEGADIYQIAKNCRTSVEMIEKFYAAHIKNVIDAAAVNVRKERSDDRPKRGAANAKRPPAGTGRGYPRPRR